MRCREIALAQIRPHLIARVAQIGLGQRDFQFVDSSRGDYSSVENLT